MYRVLLVDDEPLILSGIKFMVDWQKQECDLVGTARNGKQAVEQVEALMPDIVIADIKMPVMDGIELLQMVSEKHPHIVFLMLSNLQEFHLAQEALRLRAVDYLTKSQLEAEVLVNALGRAKEEVEKRRSLAQDGKSPSTATEAHKAAELAAEIFLSQKPFSAQQENLLAEKGVFEGYSVLCLQFSPGGNAAEEVEADSLLNWEAELVEKLAKNFFAHYYMIDDKKKKQLYVLHWGDAALENHPRVEEFFERLCSVSNNITNLQPSLRATGTLVGAASRADCHAQLEAMAEHAYLQGQRFVYYDAMPPLALKPLHSLGLQGRLKMELNSRNATACQEILHKAARLLETEAHERVQGVWLCTDLYNATLKSIEDAPDSLMENVWIADTEARFAELETALWRSQLVQWLHRFAQELDHVFKPLGSSRQSVIELAKQYTKDNIGRKISLQEVANHVCMSASYFSALFKKETEQSYVDYANQLRIEKGCELIRMGKYRMNEIAYMLGFENAYYFSKVFRRYMGVSPTEYQHRANDGPLAEP